MNTGLALLYVFLGGGLGSVARFLIGRLFMDSSRVFPWNTFIANFLACVLLGCLFAYVAHKGDRPVVQLVFIAGFCGGFSTFSTFTLENYRLFQQGQWGLLLAYIGLSIFVCFLGFVLGLKGYGSVVS